MTASAKKTLHWIAGYPKSGTTLIRTMIHKLLYGPDGPDGATARLDLSTPHMTSLTSLYAQEFDDGLRDATDAWPDMVRRARRVQSKAAARGADLFVKTHAANATINDVSFIDWDLSASFIYVYRDPREILGSYAHHFGLSLDQSLTSLNNEQNIHGTPKGLAEPLLSWSQNVLSWSPKNDTSFLILKFEDIVDERRKTTEVLNDFFRFGRSARDLDSIATQTGFEYLKNQEEKFGFHEAKTDRRFFRQGQKSSWADIDHQKYIAPIIEQNGALMSKLGYLR